MGQKLARRLGAATGLAAAVVLGSGVTAYAHECINSSRSDMGNTQAGANSQAWFTLNVEDALAGDVESGAITEEQAACIYDAYAATGSPLSFTIHVKGVVGQGGVIGANNPNEGLMSDGRGIDHVFDTYGEAIVGSYLGCGAGFPG